MGGVVQDRQEIGRGWALGRRQAGDRQEMGKRWAGNDELASL